MEKKSAEIQHYHIRHFNPLGEIKSHEYLTLVMPWQNKHVMAPLINSLHSLRCKIGRCKFPKEEWSEITC